VRSARGGGLQLASIQLLTQVRWRQGREGMEGECHWLQDSP